MKAAVWKLAFLALIFAPHVGQGRESGQDGSRTLIITKGDGGDAAGATVMRDRWRHGTPDLINLSRMPLDELEPSQYRCVLVIGQGAVSDVARSAAITAKLSGKSVGLYAHLIDQNTLELLQKLRGRTALNLFFTRSQLTLLKLRNISGYRLLDSPHNQVWRKASQVIETVSPAKLAAGDAKDSLLAANEVIWLGGSFTTSSGKRRLFTADEIVAALKPLQGAMKPGSSVAVMLAPRIFERGMSAQEKGKLLVAIRDAFGRNETTFYGNEALISDLGNAGVSLRTAPSYETLMRLPWSARTKHYASVDQYNLFTDMKPEVEPFLFDPNDADQALYAADYINGERANLTSAILKHGCDQKSTAADAYTVRGAPSEIVP
ncbi:hypothetical protein [Pandoraea pulmonicola]|uniref:Uncharacterized protein n=1 Tax=Pandoraea pulmonicola TaxID=93221 RepID=A0AAJ5CYJ1_PANPU|nr:hypothetical protein [Pandoraea pulmonicola]APD13468.1 hypothetical protein RO07_20700 [Pandoraea pulmonicola]SUA88610.1 Uncharacterised protein [Pandoraea pulmonicola]